MTSKDEYIYICDIRLPEPKHTHTTNTIPKSTKYKLCLSEVRAS